MARSTMFVCRGRTVIGPDKKAFAPGEMVTLDAAEAEFLAERGFLQDVLLALLPPPVPNPAGIGRKDPDVQGPRY